MKHKDKTEFLFLFKSPVLKDWVFAIYVISIFLDILSTQSPSSNRGVGPVTLLVSYALVFPILIVRRIVVWRREKKLFSENGDY